MKKKQFEYNWEKWLAEEHLILRQGRDFDCEPYVMAQQFRNKIRIYTRDGKNLAVSVECGREKLHIHITEID